MDLIFNKKDGTGIVSVNGGLSAANADRFTEQFERWLEDEPKIKDVVVNLSGVDNMDSSGLGSLLKALKLIWHRQGDLYISCLQKKPRVVFEITRAYKMFEIFDTEQEALNAFE